MIRGLLNPARGDPVRPTLRRPYWPAAILIAVAASLAVPSALAAQATPGAASLTAPPRTAVARQVFLIDGSQLVIHRLPDGSQETAIRPAGGLSRSPSAGGHPHCLALRSPGPAREPSRDT